MIVICLGFAIPVSYTALYAQSLGLSNAGMFFFVGAIAMTASRFLGGRLLDIVPPRILFLLTNLCGIAMFLVMAFVHTEWMLYIGGILLRPVDGLRVSAAQLDGGQEHTAGTLGRG